MRQFGGMRRNIVYIIDSLLEDTTHAVEIMRRLGLWTTDNELRHAAAAMIFGGRSPSVCQATFEWER